MLQRNQLREMIVTRTRTAATVAAAVGTPTTLPRSSTSPTRSIVLDTKSESLVKSAMSATFESYGRLLENQLYEQARFRQWARYQMQRDQAQKGQRGQGRRRQGLEQSQVQDKEQRDFVEKDNRNNGQQQQCCRRQPPPQRRQKHNDTQSNGIGMVDMAQGTTDPVVGAFRWNEDGDLVTTVLLEDTVIHVKAGRLGFKYDLSTIVHEVSSDRKDRGNRIEYLNSKLKFDRSRLEVRGGDSVYLIRTGDLKDLRQPWQLTSTLQRFKEALAIADALFRDRRWRGKYHRRSNARVVYGSICTLPLDLTHTEGA